MADKEDREQMKAFMEKDFLPPARSLKPDSSEARSALALEYIAYSLGQIRKDVRRMADKLLPKD